MILFTHRMKTIKNAAISILLGVTVSLLFQLDILPGNLLPGIDVPFGWIVREDEGEIEFCKEIKESGTTVSWFQDIRGLPFYSYESLGCIERINFITPYINPAVWIVFFYLIFSLIPVLVNKRLKRTV